AVAALDHAELAGPRHFLAESDAAGTDDAAVAPDPDVRTEVLRVLDLLVLFEAREALPVLVGVVLQVALARLVADRTVQRVVDEHVLEDRLAAGVDLRPLGGDFELVGDRVHAGDFELLRVGDLDEAHAAVAAGWRPGCQQ